MKKGAYSTSTLDMHVTNSIISEEEVHITATSPQVAVAHNEVDKYINRQINK